MEYQQNRLPCISLEQLEPRTLFSVAFKQTNLVADTTGASHMDTNLVNAWGLAAGPNTEWWIADNGTGKSTLYNGSGVPDSLVVTIPPPNGSSALSLPTGEVFNGGSGFAVGPSAPAQFLFSTEDGTISGWAPGADPTHAIRKIDHSSTGAVYKGLAIESFNGHSFLLATDFHHGRVDVFDSSFQPAHLSGSFRDRTIPAGYSPFGIQNIGGLIYVTYAQQDLYAQGDSSGPGHGFVNVFKSDGSLLHRLIKHGTLNSPWGVARIPGGFGKFKHDIAVGNFGDGFIQVFNPDTGAFVGFFKKANGHKIHIDGLWALQFGNDGLAGSSHNLFFTAGPGHEAHGLFGKLSVVSTTTVSSVSLPGYSNPQMHAMSFSTDRIIPSLVGSDDVGDV